MRQRDNVGRISARTSDILRAIPHRHAAAMASRRGHDRTHVRRCKRARATADRHTSEPISGYLLKGRRGKPTGLQGKRGAGSAKPSSPVFSASLTAPRRAATSPRCSSSVVGLRLPSLRLAAATGRVCVASLHGAAGLLRHCPFFPFAPSACRFYKCEGVQVYAAFYALAVYVTPH